MPTAFLILGKDVESRVVDIDVKIDFFLRPEVAELFAQIRRGRSLIEGSYRSPLGVSALGKEFIDVDLRKFEDDLNGLLVIRQLVPDALLRSASWSSSIRVPLRP